MTQNFCSSSSPPLPLVITDQIGDPLQEDHIVVIDTEKIGGVLHAHAPRYPVAGQPFPDHTQQFLFRVVPVLKCHSSTLPL